MFVEEEDLNKAKSTTSPDELNKYLLKGAEYGNLELVKYCLRAGADPSSMVRFGRNALHIAAERGDIRIGKILVEIPGMDLNAGTYHSYTPLHLACNSSKHAFLEFLLKNGATVDIPDKLGRTALHYAVGNRDEEMAKCCLEYGANANIMDNLQSTPLSIAAVDTTCLPLVKLLLKYKTNPNFRRQFCIPIFLDCILNINEGKDCTNTYKILSLLLKYGVSPNVFDLVTKKNGLHYAAMSGNLELGVFLVQQGTDPFDEDCMGRTPLDIARQFNHYPMMLWLQNLTAKNDHVSEKSFTSHDMYF